MSRVNKAAIVANANTARKRCCCKQLPCPRPGLRVDIIQKFTNANRPTTADDIAEFEFGDVTDGGIITEAIDFVEKLDMEKLDKWIEAIPALEGNNGNNFALRFTGYITFETAGKTTIKVRTDDGLVMKVNGERLKFDKPINPKGQACNTHAAKVNVGKGLAYIEITWYQRGGGLCLQLFEGDTIIHPSRFVHYV